MPIGNYKGWLTRKWVYENIVLQSGQPKCFFRRKIGFFGFLITDAHISHVSGRDCT